MKNSELADLTFGSFNVGWEMTGTFNAGMQLRNISAKYATQQKTTAIR